MKVLPQKLFQFIPIFTAVHPPTPTHRAGFDTFDSRGWSLMLQRVFPLIIHKLS